ncbi:hypothetical protein [Secundilactobacillus similis]|uniref:Surface layer protein A domain-containing protein n=1 Tax=Secundilactobacillus similis DSM 23365 = JCM 2765 TaxID=1423804 RepID=A0A0R2FDE3_9LACO|nr:hypothetical protein [Secundilactobacillus similis]KRN26483.1 hypothetical protein FD14_GL001512 [Secundilactobacillus similis DSM 23365 = JCM 2765]
MMTIKTTKKMVTSAILFSSLLGATIVSSVTSVTTANAAEVTTTAKASDTSSVKMLAKHSATATKQVAAVTVTQNIAYGVDWLKNTLDHASLDAWDAVALNQSGLSDAWTADDTDIDGLKATIIQNIEAGYSDGASLATKPQTTDYERDILGLLAAGYSPDQLTAVPSTTNDSTTDLVGLMVDGLTDGNPDVYALSYGIAALTSMKLESDDATYDDEIKTAINQLLALQGVDPTNNNEQTNSGYWKDSYGGITDVNGMVLQALAPYANGTSTVSDIDTATVKTAVTTAANAITSTENGFLQADGNIYDSNSLYGEANSSSNSMVLAGLTACGIELTDSTGSINDKIATAILTYQVAQGETDAGSFNWASDATYDRHLSTQEGVYGLDQYNNGSAKWLFDFTSTD